VVVRSVVSSSIDGKRIGRLERLLLRRKRRKRRGKRRKRIR
jgi:hypothetical protein